MNSFRKIFFPFSLLYDFVTGFRNFFYDKGILKSFSFELPIIVVGNLSVGGTGKTPQIEYLIRLLSDKYNVATLSRGYKRQSKGFILAGAGSNAVTLGDEPFQYYQKFPNIQVAVDNDRKNGIVQLLLQTNKPQVVLLDDAFQHRKVKAGFYILLTSYKDLYVDDYILPTGNLRESERGVQRANVIIVTKCPKDITSQEQTEIKFRLNLNQNQQLYFTYVDYNDSIYSQNSTLKVETIKNTEKLLLAGIANPQPFFDYLQNDTDIIMKFADHHHFSENDILKIKNKANNKIIITTEKDYVRLKGSIENNQLFYLPIESRFVSDKENFNKTILNYVGKSSGISKLY